jgi:hypothetical protein
VSDPPDRTLSGAGRDTTLAAGEATKRQREVAAWRRSTSSTDTATTTIPFSSVSLSLFSPPTLGFLLPVHFLIILSVWHSMPSCAGASPRASGPEGAGATLQLVEQYLVLPHAEISMAVVKSSGALVPSPPSGSRILLPRLCSRRCCGYFDLL